MNDIKKAGISVPYATASDDTLLAELGARTFYDTLSAQYTLN